MNRLHHVLLHQHPVDDAADRLHRAGWSCGEIRTTTGWLVVESNGENVIEVRGENQAEAWKRAAEAARLLGMLR